MSDSANYPLESNDFLTNAAYLLKDLSGKPEPIEIDALAASGDIFVMLASILDDATDLLTSDARNVHPQLEPATTILLYLQRNYKIARKQTDYRQ